MQETAKQPEDLSDFHWAEMGSDVDAKALANLLLNSYSKAYYEEIGLSKLHAFVERMLQAGTRAGVLPDTFRLNNETVFVLKNNSNDIQGVIRIEFKRGKSALHQDAYIDHLFISKKLRNFSGGRSYLEQLGPILNRVCRNNRIKNIYFDADLHSKPSSFYNSFAYVLGLGKNKKTARYMMQLDLSTATPFTDAIRQNLRERKKFVEVLDAAAKGTIFHS